jgi:hypothetical protein
MLAALLAGILASASAADRTPGALLTRELSARFVAADLLTPTDLAKWEAAAAEWTHDPAWEGAKGAAEGAAALRRGLTGPDPAALEEGVRNLAGAFDIRQPGDDALAARYEALRLSLSVAGVVLEPETGRFRGPDGAPLDQDDWRAHLEKLPPDVRRRLYTVFGSACGVGEKPPVDPLAYVPKKKAPPKAAPVVVKAPPRKKAAPAPKPTLAPVVAKAGPKAEAVAREMKALRTALDAPALAARLAEADKAELLKAWEKALDAAVSDEGKVDHSLAVNALRDLTAPASPTAARWGFIAAATYNLGSDLGPKAALAVVLAKTGTQLSAGRLFSKAMVLAGAQAAPKDEKALGAAIKDGTALESASAGWSAALPNPKKSNPLDGTVKTFKLESTVNKFRGYFGL